MTYEIKDKRVLVAGGAGSIGSEIVRQLAPKNKIFILDIDETGAFDLTEELMQDGHWVHCRIGDVKEKDTVSDVFSDFKPQVIFNAAALKHVTPNEWYPEEAVRTNVLGNLNLINEAKRWECLERFVFISTDKVLGYSVMGATKRLSEIITRRQGKGFITVRFGNVLGSRGSVIPLWQNQMNRKKPITVTDPTMTRYFMTIEEAVELVIHAAQEGEGGEIFILDMGKEVNILDLAKKIIKESGEEAKIRIIGTRPGEQISEKLMSEEEEKVAIKKDKFWVIK